MLCHDHLSQLRDERAQSVIAEQSFIGVYVPTSIEWVGALSNKVWSSTSASEAQFAWQLNLSTCAALLVTLHSCLEAYVRDEGERVRLEAALSEELSKAWSDGEWKSWSFREVRANLEDVGYRKQQQLARRQIGGSETPEEVTIGVTFSAELFTPLKRGILLAQRALSLKGDAVWAVCLDEAEVLEPFHHRIINSFLRSTSLPLVFKMTTMPYCHYTLETNTAVPLNVGHDFEYVYIDEGPSMGNTRRGESERTFATTVFQKRAKRSGTRYRSVTLERLLGESRLLDPKQEDWGSKSSNMDLLRQYGSPETVARALALSSDEGQFRDQVARKLHAALLLRSAVADVQGRGEIDLYSGVSMAVRCGDGNPRRLIRIFNAFLLEAKWERNRGRVGRIRPLTAKAQTRILTEFSSSTLARVQSEPEVGPELHEFLNRIGRYMSAHLHGAPITTDQVSSFVIERDVGDTEWRVIQRAVMIGLLFPNVGLTTPDQMPDREGTFRLAYVLAPTFKLLPRRGKARGLRTMLQYSGGHMGEDQGQLPI
jgi:hypothetical protein